MTADSLFGVDAPPPPEPVEKLSADRRRTIRQAAALAAGNHPLSLVVGHLRLHTEAAPADDRKAPGRRCGDCRFLGRSFGHLNCSFGETPEGHWPRSSHGPATDVRAWWPGCTDHQYEEATS